MNYEAAFALSSDMAVDPDTLLYPALHSKGRQYARYSNPEVDKLLDKAGASYDQAERKVLYA